MADDFGPLERDWQCGWESHRHAQAVRLAGLPFSKKLDWLEQAQRLAGRLAGVGNRSSGGESLLGDKAIYRGAAPKDAAEENPGFIDERRDRNARGS